MDNKKRAKRIWFRVTPDEFAAIQQKQHEANIISREAFLRKMVMEGKILKLEIPELREISALLGRCSSNLNQIARRVNSTGRLYAGDLSETKQKLEQVENMM
ncbi:MAG: plasmid mobilization relaxosome protein MobC, partial [Clostridia bacterium]|nr:plasmid mobilization relaxosome protein MobC [Clostridia bacterium]